MSAAKHTPGPWRFNEATQTVVSNQSHPVARLAEPFHRQVQNGKTGNDGPLIAAAPELLEALIESVALADLSMGEAAKKLGLVPTRSPRMQAMYAKCCAAIAKATGGAV